MRLGPARRLLGSRAHRRAAARDRQGGGVARASTRSGPPRPTARTPPPCSPGWPRRPRRIKLGSAIFQMPGRTPAMTAMTAATLDNLSGGRMLLGHRLLGPAGGRGLARPAVRQAAPAHARVRGDPAQGARARAARVRRRAVHAADPRRAGQGAEADDRRRCRSGSRSTSPRSARRTRSSPARSPTAGCPPSSPPSTWREFRELLEEGAARRATGKAIDDSFDIAPDVNVCDRRRHRRGARLDAADPRAVRRAAWARANKNFYNALVRRYGFEDAAEEVQDLYLDGKKDEAAAALPAELIDQTCARAGRKDRVAERLAVYRDAGVGTLMLHARWRSTPEGRGAMMRELAEIALSSEAAVPARRVRRPRARLPGDRARARRWCARGHEVCLQTWEQWQRGRRARGHALRAGARVHGLPRPGGGARSPTRRRCGPRARRRR